MAHLINRGYDLGTGGLDLPPPSKELGRGEGTLATAMTAAAGSDLGHQQQPTRKYYPRTFDFLDLGAMVSGVCRHGESLNLGATAGKTG